MMTFPIYGNMFQTTNQIRLYIWIVFPQGSLKKEGVLLGCVPASCSCFWLNSCVWCLRYACFGCSKLQVSNNFMRSGLAGLVSISIRQLVPQFVGYIWVCLEIGYPHWCLINFQMNIAESIPYLQTHLLWLVTCHITHFGPQLPHTARPFVQAAAMSTHPECLNSAKAMLE